MKYNTDNTLIELQLALHKIPAKAKTEAEVREMVKDAWDIAGEVCPNITKDRDGDLDLKDFTQAVIHSWYKRKEALADGKTEEELLAYEEKHTEAAHQILQNSMGRDLTWWDKISTTFDGVVIGFGIGVAFGLIETGIPSDWTIILGLSAFLLGAQSLVISKYRRKDRAEKLMEEAEL